MRRHASFRRRAKRLLDDSIHAGRSVAAARPGVVPAYDRLLHHVRSRSALLRPSGRPGDVRSHLNAALLALALHHADWLRPAETWVPVDRSPGGQFASLAEHLLALHPVPPCVTGAWFDLPPGQALPQHEWYKHLGRGGSLRTAGLPLPVTRAVGHWLNEAPAHLGPVAGVRWAQVRAMGGGDELARAVAATRLGRVLEHEDFWVTFVRFVVRQRSFPTHEVGPVVDFLRHQKFEWRAGVSAGGVFGPQPLPRPDYELKGRTAASVLRDVAEWHRLLGQGDRGPGRSWRPAPVHPFRRVDGTAAAGDMRVWTITELLTDRDLVLEGQAMRHCVAAYADRCARGQASVWTLRVETGRGGRRALTVEVDPAGRVVRQARGTANRRPRPAELDVLAAWAAAEGLRVPDPERL